MRGFILGIILGITFAAASAASAHGQCTEQTFAGAEPDSVFGQSVAVEGDVMAIGITDPDGFGELRILTRSEPGAPWGLSLVLDSLEDPGLGQSVAVHDGQVVVGSPGADGGRGQVLVVDFDLQGQLVALDTLVSPLPPADSREFGFAVDLDGDVLAVGEPGVFDEAGKLHFFRRQPDGSFAFESTFEQTLPVNGTPGDRMGHSVAVSGQFVVVGMPGEDFLANDTGITYFLQDHPSLGWSIVLAPGGFGQDGMRFGTSVAIDGDHVVIGSPYYDFTEVDGGRLDFFVYDGLFFQVDTFVAGTEPGQHLGWSVALSGDLAVGGEPGDPGLGSDSGRVGVYRHDGSAWQDLGVDFSAHDTTLRDRFGHAVALDGESVVASAELAGPPGVDEGAVSTYELAGFGLCIEVDSDLVGAGGAAPVLGGAGATTAGGAVTVTLSQGAPSTFGFLFVGFSVLDAPLKGGVLVPSPDIVLPVATDGAGGYSLLGSWPAGVPSHVPVWVQAWLADPAGPQGASASDTLVLLTP
jgi:hypothetical protein